MGRNSNYNRKSGGTGFLITAGIIFLALKGLPGLLLGVAIGAGVGAIASIMGKSSIRRRITAVTASARPRRPSSAVRKKPVRSRKSSAANRKRLPKSRSRAIPRPIM